MKSSSLQLVLLASIFGFFSSIAAYFIQALILSFFQGVLQNIFFIFFFVLIEEIAKFLFIKKLFGYIILTVPFVILSGFFFGFGFSLLELFFIHSSSYSNPSAFTFFPLLIHITTSALWSYGFYKHSKTFLFGLLAIILHLSYNIIIFFFFS